MNAFIALVQSIAAGVVANIISKWLDGFFKDGKH